MRSILSPSTLDARQRLERERKVFMEENILRKAECKKVSFFLSFLLSFSSSSPSTQLTYEWGGRVLSLNGGGCFTSFFPFLKG